VVSLWQPRQAPTGAGPGQTRCAALSEPGPSHPLSTQARALAWEVALTEADGVPTPCVVKPEWIRIVDRSSLGPLVVTLPPDRWPEIRAALLDILGFDP
jgi:mRNA-degrading endonuclease toxin of MazEF toxin-antitoxin module